MCAPLQYDFYDSKVAGNQPPTGLLPGTVNAVTNPNTNVVATDYFAKTTYPFYVKVTIEGGQEIWATCGGSEQWNLQVVCGPVSTTLIEQTTTFPNPLNQVQYTEKNQGNCFMMPRLDSTLGVCPIVTLQSSTINGGVINPGSNFLNDPVETFPGSGMYKVCPHDDSLDARYEFYVKYTADGGASSFT